MRERGILLSLVERGWQAARECSLEAAAAGCGTTHLIKGWVPPEVLYGLTPPQPRIRLVGVPKRLFWPIAWLAAMSVNLSGALRAVLVDNERAAKRVGRWLRGRRDRIYLVRPGAQRYELWLGQRQVHERPWHPAARACASR